MVDLQVATLAGANTMLAEAAVEDFRVGLRGQLILPGDPGYDEARLSCPATQATMRPARSTTP